jgi:hemerythrin-like domain-containing protein
VKTDIIGKLMEEHRLILRMITLLENNARATAEGRYKEWRFYLDGVDFIRGYADRFHHAKEEDVLFTTLVMNGMPEKNSPVAAMLMEHEQGRDYVRQLENAVSEAMEGIAGREEIIAQNAMAYAELLREHITKENGILYPLAERIIPEAVREDILKRYQEAEAGNLHVLGGRWLAMVEKYESEQDWVGSNPDNGQQEFNAVF